MVAFLRLNTKPLGIRGGKVSHVARFSPRKLPAVAISRTGMSPQPTTLVSFDVDGTLIESVGDQANLLHKQAFAHGFKVAFDLDTHIDVVKHHGSTDPLIIIKVAMYHGLTKEQAMAGLPRAKAAMEEYFLSNQEQATVGLSLLPGVKELLHALKANPAAASCLVTGNLEPIGWTKMQHLGLLDLFTEPRFGGFGSDFCSGNTEETWRDRAEFVRIAAQKCSSVCGDTPMDIQAALDAGAVPIGVATGIFSREALEAVAPGVTVLDSLADLAKVIALLGLPCSDGHQNSNQQHEHHH